ncbi:MAG: DMT family transporter [Verrucomicrobia bacterium]|nr:DMT family transporter [Cytophagales bacterium]
MPEVINSEIIAIPFRQTARFKYLLGAGLVFLGAVCFSAKAVLIKIAFRDYHIDSVSLLALRMLFAFPFFAVVAFVLNKRTGNQLLTFPQWVWLGILGVVGYYLASIFDFEGLQYVTASVERLILFVYPTLVVLISAILFRKKITKIQLLALFLTYAGMLVAFTDDAKTGLQQDLITGGLWIFASAFTYAWYMVGSGELIPKVGSMKFTAYAMLFATLAIVSHFLLTKGFDFFNFPPQIYGIALLMAIFSTVIPTFMVSEGIRLVGSGNASIIGGIGPVATIVLANVFLGEAIGFWQVSGTFVVLAGVVMIGWKGKKT